MTIQGNALYEKEFKLLVATNALASSQTCESFHAQCEEAFEQLRNMRLPSMKKFDDGVQAKNHSFQTKCVSCSQMISSDELSLP